MECLSMDNNNKSVYQYYLVKTTKNRKVLHNKLINNKKFNKKKVIKLEEEKNANSEQYVQQKQSLNKLYKHTNRNNAVTYLLLCFVNIYIHTYIHVC